MRRAWPPPPKVQSTAVWPGCGRQQLGQLGGEDGLVLGRHIDKVCAIQPSGCVEVEGSRALGPPSHSGAPFAARPSAISGAEASSSASCLAQASAFQISRYSPAPTTTQGAGEAGVLDQRLGHADAAGGVELLVEGAAVEAAAQLARVAAEGAVRREEAVGELLELLGRVHPDAGVEALGQNNAVGEGGPEPGGNREAILGIETVLVETPKCHRSGSFLCGAWTRKRVRTGVMRWEEPHHPGPGLQLERHSNPLPPTLQHDPTMQAHLQPRCTGLRCAARESSEHERDRASEPPAEARPTTPTTCAASTSGG